MYKRFSRISIPFLLFSLNNISGDVIGQKKVICLRVEFQESESSGTTGNGHFLMNPDTTCGNYIIDPPPHDKTYFQSQLEAVNNYFHSVSYQKFGIDLDQSNIFPESNNFAYTLPFPMDYYNPYGESESLKEERLITLFKDAIFVADSVDLISFEDSDFVIVFHAGIGQDFSLPYLDPTPEDIPSTYVDRDMLGEPFLGVEHGIILPETENHLLFEEGSILFDQASEPCDYQYGLTGVMALMVGFASELPPLWDLESGESRIGIFGLMDQGSNNGRGLIPSPPDAWTRIFAGWETPTIVRPSNSISLLSRSENNIIKIPMTDSEYFLIENRENSVYDKVSIDSVRYAIWEETDRYPPLIEILMDSVSIEKDENGVIISVPNYDLGLPASGLLIWHIDEEIINIGINDYRINSDRILKGIDLEEADGAQDIGYPSIFLFQDPSGGYFGDVWFDGNPEYKRLNNGFELPEFGPNTYPNTHSNSGTASYIRIFGISEPGDTMSFSVSNSHQLDGFPDFSAHFQLIHQLGTKKNIIGGIDSVWWAPISDPFNRTVFHIKENPDNSFFFSLTGLNENGIEYLNIIEHSDDSTIWNKFDMIADSLNYFPIEQIILDSIKFIVGGDISQEYDILGIDAYNNLLNTAKVINEVDTTLFRIDENTLIVFQGNSIEMTKEFEYSLIKLIAIDLDLDGRGEALVLNENGTLYALDQNLNYFPGFPVQDTFHGNLFAHDILGDSHPEIIVENQDKENFSILNWKGQPVLTFPLSTPERIKFISESGSSESANFIWTDYAIWLFSNGDSDESEYCCNEWSYPHGDPGLSRTLKLNYSLSVHNPEKLFDSHRTYAYPNPAKDNFVKIRIQVESANHIECEIYDLAGFYIDKLILDNPIQGMPNEIVWEVSDVESGIYYIDITAQGNNRTQSKLIKAGIVH